MVSILYSLPQVEDPSCFWIAVKQCGGGLLSEAVYENLNAEMKQFYNKDADEIKGEEVEKGQVRSLLCIEIIYCLNGFRGKVSNTWGFLFLNRKIDNSISMDCFLICKPPNCARFKACILQRKWKAV